MYLQGLLIVWHPTHLPNNSLRLRAYVSQLMFLEKNTNNFSGISLFDILYENQLFMLDSSYTDKFHYVLYSVTILSLAIAIPILNFAFPKRT